MFVMVAAGSLVTVKVPSTGPSPSYTVLSPMPSGFSSVLGLPSSLGLFGSFGSAGAGSVG